MKSVEFEVMWVYRQAFILSVSTVCSISKGLLDIQSAVPTVHVSINQSEI